MEKTYTTSSEQETQVLGTQIGSRLRGGEVLVLQSDLGGGKTTLTKGIAVGVGSVDHVSSPTFTIQQTYQGTKLKLYHYDFYRISDLGLLKEELSEALGNMHAVIVMEWAGDAVDVVDKDRIVVVKISKNATNSEKRTFEVSCSKNMSYILNEDE